MSIREVSSALPYDKAAYSEMVPPSGEPRTILQIANALCDAHGIPTPPPSIRRLEEQLEAAEHTHMAMGMLVEIATSDLEKHIQAQIQTRREVMRLRQQLLDAQKAGAQ